MDVLAEETNDTRLKVYRNGSFVGMIFLPEVELNHQRCLKKRLSHMKGGKYTMKSEDEKEWSVTISNSLDFCSSG